MIKMTGKDESFNPLLVMSIHGIRTHARWQTEWAELLCRENIRPKSYYFGRFGLSKFLLTPVRNKKLDEFYEFYGSCITEFKLNCAIPAQRPSIVVHSFGTYILGYCMLKYEDVKFDKIILCGSILPNDFDWSKLFNRDQVGMIRNEYGIKDIWANIVKYFVANTGRSGNKGFEYINTGLVDQQRFEYFSHSDYFHVSHMRSHWLTFLRRRPSVLRVKHARDISEPSIFMEYIRDGANIDKACFGDLADYRDLPDDKVYSWFLANPDIYTLLVSYEADNAEKLRGYANVMPIDEETYQKILRGEISDDEITKNEIVPYISDQHVKLYFMSIAISPDVRHINQGLFQEGLERLINGVIDKLSYYAIYHKIKVTDIISTAWTKEGVKLCHLFGMSETKVSDRYGHPIYHLNFENMPTSRVLPGIRRLSQKYKNMD